MSDKQEKKLCEIEKSDLCLDKIFEEIKKLENNFENLNSDIIYLKNKMEKIELKNRLNKDGDFLINLISLIFVYLSLFITILYGMFKKDLPYRFCFIGLPILIMIVILFFKERVFNKIKDNEYVKK